MITVNGQTREVASGTTVSDLVNELAAASLDGRGVAVARNGEVVPRAAWADTPVSVGDRLEVLTANPGG